MAAAGAALRTLQEWLGHREFKTTPIYADYQPERARGRARRAGVRRGVGCAAASGGVMSAGIA
jgi:hypothetical protein